MKKLLLITSLFIFSVPAWAENALTLPQGKFRARIKPIYASDITQQYNDAQDNESLVSKFEKDLDQNTAAKINPGLAIGMKALGIQSLGVFAPGLELSTLVLGTAVEYGVTENLTLGVIMPIMTANTKFSIGFNKSAKAKVTAPFKTMDFVDLAEKNATSKGYAPFEDWEHTGIGDIEVGLKYRWLHTKNWSLATEQGIRLPTGRVDDPDHLTDVGFGDGQTDIGAKFLLDWRGLSNLLVNLKTEYTVQLPDRQDMRVPDEGELFTYKKEDIRRDLGDKLDAQVYTEYTFLKNFNVNAAYLYSVKSSDQFASDLGYNAAALEDNTSKMKQAANVGLGFSTIPWVKAGTFAFPMEIGLNAQLPLAGKNVAKATTVNLEYKLYF